MPFSGLVVRWYSWISDQVMAKENNTRSFSLVVSGWTKVTKERHSRACLAQRWRVFLRGRSLTKFRWDYISQFGWYPWKPWNLNTLWSLYPYSIFKTIILSWAVCCHEVSKLLYKYFTYKVKNRHEELCENKALWITSFIIFVPSVGIWKPYNCATPMP